MVYASVNGSSICEGNVLIRYPRPGPIYRLTFFGAPRVFISTHQLVDEVFDEERFSKMVAGSLNEIRNGVHDGLFTAHYPGEENWAMAHRVLVPAFGPLSIRDMFDGQYVLAFNQIRHDCLMCY